LDTTSYDPGQKITDDEMRSLRLKPRTFHGDWNPIAQHVDLPTRNGSATVDALWIRAMP
jgi:hypothetical protein